MMVPTIIRYRCQLICGNQASPAHDGQNGCRWSQTALPGDHRDVEPPDPIPNSEVKRVIADGSMGVPHARVGHCQALNLKTPSGLPLGVFCYAKTYFISVCRESAWRRVV